MKSTSKLGRDGRFWGLVMVAPTIIGLMILNIIPFFQTIYMSFSKTKAFGAYQFCGLENYLEMVPQCGILECKLELHLLLHPHCAGGRFSGADRGSAAERKDQGQDRLPRHLLPAHGGGSCCGGNGLEVDLQCGVWHSESGPWHDIRWLTDPKIVLVTCAIVSIWSSIGYDAVLLLSGIQNISQSLYEAAELDGASKIRQFFSITLPMVSPTLFVVLIMRLMASLKVYDLIYMMVEQTNPALTSAQSLMYLFYRESFVAGNKGYASAIVVWTVLLIGLVTLVQFIGQKKWVNYEV